MSIKDKYKVESIKPFETYDWLKNKHYAKRIPPISYAFGLFQGNVLNGVCCFGIPASRFENIKQPYELNRLVINDDLDKNVLSYFVSNCLKLFPKNNIIVSYADPNNGHHGYIYQATNWIYMGKSCPHNDWYIDGKLLHEKTIFNMYGTCSVKSLKKKGINITYKKTLAKHRYFYFTGTKKQKQFLLNSLKYKIEPYPKGQNKRYDASYEPKVQLKMF